MIPARMARKKSPAPTEKVKTSLSVDPRVYNRAQKYKADLRLAGKRIDLGDIVTEALKEYLTKHGA